MWLPGTYNDIWGACVFPLGRTDSERSHGSVALSTPAVRPWLVAQTPACLRVGCGEQGGCMWPTAQRRPRTPGGLSEGLKLRQSLLLQKSLGRTHKWRPKRRVLLSKRDSAAGRGMEKVGEQKRKESRKRALLIYGKGES